MMIPLLLLFAAQSAEIPDLGTRRSGVDWPGFLGPTRDGISTERGVVSTKWPLRQVWQRELGESYGACSVARGRLYVFDRRGENTRLSCLKSETGEELWTFEYASSYQDGYGAGNGPRCSPLVDGDRVYIFGPDGMLHCIHAQTGKMIWKKSTSEEFGVVQNFFGVGSNPLVEGDLLIAQIGGSPPGSPEISSGEVRGLDSGIVAFDKRTGAVKYKITDELASYSSPVAATINGRRWCFVFARGGLVGFEPATGKVDFRHPWRARSATTVNISNPVVVGDHVLVSEAYGPGSALLKVRPGGYHVVWESRALSAYWNTPIHVDGHLYGSHGMGSEAPLRCIELSTGKVKWTDTEVKQCSLLYVDGHFVALSEDGALRRIKVNPERCEKLDRVEMPLIRHPARAAPILSHGLLYVRGKDRLICLELIPLDVDSYSRRGDAHFMKGDYAQALADYEKMVELDPRQDAGHWRRGIAWFHAGEYAKAARQFEIYHTHDDVDRENGIWRFLSQAKASGIEKARAGLLKYAKDDREPFPAVYRLFEGKITPEQILAQIESAAVDKEQRLFYAHLYIGLNSSIENRPEEAAKFLKLAAENAWAPKAGYGPNYMWHVARLQHEMLKKR